MKQNSFTKWKVAQRVARGECAEFMSTLGAYEHACVQCRCK